MPIAELARRERVRHQSMTRTVTLLERGGLAIQRPDPTNGRQVAVFATPADRRLLERERATRRRHG